MGRGLRPLGFRLNSQLAAFRLPFEPVTFEKIRQTCGELIAGLAPYAIFFGR